MSARQVILAFQKEAKSFLDLDRIFKPRVEIDFSTESFNVLASDLKW